MRTLDDLCGVLQAPKRLVAIAEWKRVNTQLRLGAALEVDGIVTAGISFLATVLAEYPDENVTLLLQAEIKQLEQKMLQHARDLEFEQAAALRDQIHQLKLLLLELPAD